ncbi:hypothetical protein CRE_10128 [Caenorhabditis remanei]|uniref:Uncharacterized protein n=1 Tax=Caenorhabditis remanei TaxID=31234 RepID=E3M6C9_CAERE|nr:hypothetical protein CRE_10128 [Caenorhabditis remanei]
MGLMIADNPMTTPDLRKDPFYDEVDVPLLYSEESSHIPNHHYHGSASEVELEQRGNAPVMMMPHSQSAANLRRIMSFKSVDEEEKGNPFSMSHDDSRMRNWREVSLDSSYLADLNENKEWKIPTNPQKF